MSRVASVITNRYRYRHGKLQQQCCRNIAEKCQRRHADSVQLVRGFNLISVNPTFGLPLSGHTLERIVLADEMMVKRSQHVESDQEIKHIGSSGMDIFELMRKILVCSKKCR